MFKKLLKEGQDLEPHLDSINSNDWGTALKEYKECKLNQNVEYCGTDRTTSLLDSLTKKMGSSVA